MEKIKNNKNLMHCDPKNIPEHLFRAYDIRGKVTTDLSPELVHDLGLAIGTMAQDLGDKTVIVARDGRLSGPSLIQALKQGLKESGVDIIDIGVVPTPVLYFATKHLSTKSGVMLTGSHNPADYNGLKMVLHGQTIAGEEIKNLYLILKNQTYYSGESWGVEVSQEILGDYEARILREIKLEKSSTSFNLKPLKIIIDCGNGVTGVIAPRLIQNLGCEVISLFSEVDGNFPNHHPDPSKPQNLEDLQKAVLENNADLGLAFDGDGDRLGVISSSGKIIWPDRQMMLYAQDVLSRFPGEVILYDVKCTRHLGEMIQKAGGIPTMCPTGHSLVKKEIIKTGAKLAGEMSGHVFFNDTWYGFDDGIYTAARLLRILASEKDKNHSSEEVFNLLPESYSTPEITVDIPDAEKFDLMKKLIKEAEFANFPNAKLITLDGLRVEFETGFALIRVSNTTPCFVLRFEADTQEQLAEIKKIFKKFLLDHAGHLDWGVLE